MDRAALDTAIELGLPYRGFVPQGRWAEDGVIPSNYKGLTECDSREPAVRTRMNVEHSDATLILSHGKLAGGSLVTWQAARTLRKPCLHIDLDRNSDDAAVDKIVLWIKNGGFSALNIAGPRASKDPEIYASAAGVLRRIFSVI